MSGVRSIRIPIILPEEHHDAWLSYEAGKEVLVCLDSGRSTQKESHVIQKSMEQAGHIYSNHCIETYEEIKERFHYLAHQTGDPDMVRV